MAWGRWLRYCLYADTGHLNGFLWFTNILGANGRRWVEFPVRVFVSLSLNSRNSSPFSPAFRVKSPHISCRLSWTPRKPNSLALKYHTVFIRDWGVSLPNCLVSHNFSSSFLLRGCATFGRFPRPFCFKSLLRDSNTFLLSLNSLDSTRL